MKSISAIATLLLAVFFAFSAAAANQPPSWEVMALSRVLPGTVKGQVNYDLASGTISGTNGIYVKFGQTILTADSATVNTQTGEVVADGHVRIESGQELWVGSHITYNFKTRRMMSEEFRTGRYPVFAAGMGLSGDASNRVYTATNAYVTTDDVARPAYQVGASRIKIIPGKSVELWNAVARVKGVPVFYFPFYKRNIGRHSNHLSLLPGYRSTYGGFLLGTYRWFLGNDLDGKLHLDYRGERGPGVGPDVAGHFGRWGNLHLRYYYTYDRWSNTSTNAFPQYGAIPNNRQYLHFDWQATPATNLNVKALINYQSDPLVLHDFALGDYSANSQPSSFIEVNRYWDNWSLDALTTPRINSFFDQVERLPDVRLTGFRQQVFNTPLYYDSQSSVGWYRHFITYTNGLYPNVNGFYAGAAARADTYHQLTLPRTFFNWLNVTPRVGGRLTYYSSQYLTNGAPNSDVYRGVLNTGVRVSFKSSRLWRGATNSLLEIDGLRHIIEPSINYVYVPDPSTPPGQLPQFDGEQPSLMLLPLMFPDYNSIDSIDTQNVIRFGLRNILQTKRDGTLSTLLNWNLMLDWRLNPKPNQSRFNDLYSALAFRPRSWLTAESQNRYDVNAGKLNMAFEQLTFAPNDRWSWGLGYWYLRGGQWGNSTWTENNNISSTIFLRFSDNWGLRMTHNFNAVTGRLQEQFYTLYRDLRSWTSALTLRVANNSGQPADITVAFTLSLKAAPSVGLGEDVANRYSLLGE